MFELPADVAAFAAEVRAFARDRVAPGAADRDRNRRWFPEVWAELGQLGWLGLSLPQAYGGQGRSILHFAAMIEELAAVEAALALDMGPQSALAAGQILLTGTEEQKRRFVPRLATGAAIGSWALTEPEAGSDAGGVRTRAVELPGGGWKLDGEKCFITLGGRADIQVLMASTDPDRGKDGLSAFVIERPTPGLTSAPEHPTLGMCASDTARLKLVDVRLPADALLGRRCEGLKGALAALNTGRIGVAAVACGIAKACVEASVKYAAGRKQFGKPIGELPSVANLIADASTELEAARLLTYRAAARRDAGTLTPRDASTAKLAASRAAAVHAGDMAVQVHGGHGYTQEHHVERYWRDAKLTEIGEGTTQVQQMLIARYLFKEAAAEASAPRA